MGSSGLVRRRSAAVPMLSLEDHVPDDPDRFLPRCKGIYHAGCTDYPNPNLPMPLQLGQRADLAATPS